MSSDVGSRRAAVRPGRAWVRLAPWVALAAGVVVSLGWFVLARRAGDDAEAESLGREVDAVEADVTAAARSYEHLLDEISRAVASDIRSNASFEEYVGLLVLPARFPGAVGVAWIEPVPLAELASFVDAHGIGEPIAPSIGPGTVDPAYLLTYAAPSDTLGLLRGVDLRLLDPIPEVLDTAADRADETVGAAFRLPLADAVESTADRPMLFTLALPVFEGGEIASTTEVRPEQVAGWAGAVVQVEPFLRDALADRLETFRFRVFDGEVTDPDREIATVGVDEPTGDSHTVALDLLGHTWTIELTRAEPLGSGGTGEIMLLVAALVVTALVSALLYVLGRSERRARRIAAETTAELSRQERHFRALVANAHDLVVVTDDDLTMTYVSPASTRVLGRPADDLVDTDLRSLLHPDGVPAISRAALETRGDDGRIGPIEVRMRHAEGSYRWVEANATDLRDDPAVGGLVWTLEDVTERRDYRENLAHRATHDELTGLPNRTLFVDRLQNALARSRRTGRGPAVLFVDLDHFKLVNDSFGHGAGDELLRLVADRLASAVRPGDTVARFGGDEFVILAENVADVDECEAIAGRIASTLSTPFRVAGTEVYATASVGMVLADGDGDTPESLLRDADIAMYRAKDSGRACTHLFDAGSRDDVRRRLEAESALRRAVEADEVDVHYQPQYDIVTGHAIGAEALVRWEQPDNGLVDPADVIDLADSTGLIGPLGERVLRRACAQAARWRTRGEVSDDFTVAVNLSPRQIASADLPETVTRVLDETGLPASALCLEIDESALMSDVAATVAILESLKALGVRLAIDDFGTGYASLGHLKRFPVDALKIDRTFVDGLGEDPDDTVIVAAVIGLAHALGVTAVAEGVETDAQLGELRALGCDGAQGWLFSPARPADDLGAALGRSLAL